MQLPRKFLTLDGIRGVAALAVVAYHADSFFGFKVAGGYLAVDLFFLLSGFVLAHVNEPRLDAGMTAKDFLVARWVRLYPLAAAGAALGLSTALIIFVFGGGNLSLDAIAKAALTNFLMLPSAATVANTNAVFPLNVPAWSLFLELLVNFIYVVFWKRLNNITLAVIVFFSAVFLCWTAVAFHGLDVGADWRSFAGGLPRVMFSFFLGVLMRRVPPPPAKVGWWSSALVLAVAPLLLIDLPQRAVLDSVLVLVVFPLVVWLSARIEPGPLAGRIFGWLGVTSYAVYALHYPIARLAKRAFGVVGWSVEQSAPFSGLAGLILILIVAWLADRYFDAPVRRWLGVRWRRRQLAATEPTTASSKA